MSALARLIPGVALASLVSLAACEAKKEPPPPPPAPDPTGPDGLVAVLSRSEPFACLPDRPTWNALVTPAYRDRAADPLGLESYRLLRTGAEAKKVITARPLYADDATVPATLRRVRPALPIGEPPLIAFAGTTALPAVFAYHADRWWCLVDLDGLVISELDDDTCRAAYMASATGRCLDLSAPVAAAALGKNPEEERRMCGLLVAQGCGSVPPTTPP